MYDLLRNDILLLLGLVCLAGFYMGTAARKLRLPSLIGFMALGALLGPSAFKLFDPENLEGLSFITQIALGFVAFGIGSELSLASLRHLGKGIMAIILAESFCAFFVVTGVLFCLTRSWPIALLFGAVAPASAPAGTVAVIQEYKAKGKLTKALYAVVGFDDGLAILIFGFAAALARVLLLRKLDVGTGGENVLHAMSAPALEIVGSIVAGTVLGFLFCALIRRLEAHRDMLIMTFGIILTATGIAEFFHLSQILTNMVIGFVLINTRREAFAHKVTAPLQEIMPLLFLLFFTLAGAHLEISQLPKLGFLGLLYIAARTGGLMGGARMGAMLGHVDENVKKYIGLGILSQAGVAIGLSLIIQHEFGSLAARPEIAKAVTSYAHLHPDATPLTYAPLAISAALITTITATCIVFEIVGPILTKYALTQAGEIATDTPATPPVSHE